MGPPTDPSILKRNLLPFSIKSRGNDHLQEPHQLGYDPKAYKIQD